MRVLASGSAGREVASYVGRWVWLVGGWVGGLVCWYVGGLTVSLDNLSSSGFKREKTRIISKVQCGRTR